MKSLIIASCLLTLALVAARADASRTRPVLFENHNPQHWSGQCNPPSELFFDPVSGRWQIRNSLGQVRPAAGNWSFVRIDGRYYIGSSLHTELAAGVHGYPGPVEFAGEIKFAGQNALENLRLLQQQGIDLRGLLQHWNEGSGHYRPWARLACQAGLPMDLFRPAGFPEWPVAPKVFPPDFFDLGPGRRPPGNFPAVVEGIPNMELPPGRPRLPFRATNPWERFTVEPNRPFNIDLSRVTCRDVVPDGFNAVRGGRPGFAGTLVAGMGGSFAGNWGVREVCSELTDNDRTIDFWGDMGGIWGGVGATCAAQPEVAPFAVVHGLTETALWLPKDELAHQPNFWYRPGGYNVVDQPPLPGATWSAISCHARSNPPVGRPQNSGGKQRYYDMVYADSRRRFTTVNGIAVLAADAPCPCEEGNGNVRDAAVDPPFSGEGEVANGCGCSSTADGSANALLMMAVAVLLATLRRCRSARSGA